MKVLTNDKALTSQIKRLENQKKNLIIVKEGELQNLKKFYHYKAKESQLNGAQQIFDAKDIADKNLVETIDREEARLHDYRTRMQTAQSLLEKNKSELLDQRKVHLQDINQHLQESAHEEFEKGQRYIKDLGFKNRNYISKLDRNTTQKQHLLRGEARAKIQHSIVNNESKVREQEDQLIRQRQIKDLEFAKSVAAEKMAHNRYLKKLYSKNLMKKSQQTKVGNGLLEENQKFYDHQIKKQEASFQEKMNTIIKQQKALYDRVKARLILEIENTKESFVQKKELIQDKAKDEFYTIKEISPAITDLGNEYVIAIEAPLHEKEDYTFSAHGRRIKLSLARRFNQRVENEDGGFNRSRRSEIITKEFKVDDILDSSTISRKYEDGILMFKVAKL